MRPVAATLLAALLASAGTPAVAGAFRHIIIVIQENRTPDNLFGSNPAFEPGVDLATMGVNSMGVKIPLAPLALADCYDISHAHPSFEDAYTKGFDLEPNGAGKNGCATTANPQFKYVANRGGEVQPYFDIALANGFANRMFQTNQGPSFPAHQFLFGGTSAPTADTRLFAAENPPKGSGAGCAAPAGSTVTLIDAHGSEVSHQPIYPCFEHNTLADLLDKATSPITWRYYATAPGSIWLAPNAIRHICQPSTSGTLQCEGPLWKADVVPDNPAQVLTDITGCKLQSVSWVTPTAAESDHAAINNGTGPDWVANIVNAVGNTTCKSGESYWKDTAIFITWDDWGGWYDHVPPFKIVKPFAWGAGYTYGFRVPLLVVSAYTMPKQVSNEIFDFGSILAFVEKNFGLGFIGPGTDAHTNYADYQATQTGRGDLSTFFTLTSPKPFTAIHTTLTAADFINAPRSAVPPDDD